MAEASNSEKSTIRTRKGKRGDVIDVEAGTTVVDPLGNVRTMGGDKYVLDQVGTHHVGDQPYDVVDED